MYNGSTIVLCVTIFVVRKQCLIRAHCSTVTVGGEEQNIAFSRQNIKAKSNFGLPKLRIRLSICNVIKLCIYLCKRTYRVARQKCSTFDWPPCIVLDNGPCTVVKSFSKTPAIIISIDSFYTFFGSHMLAQ
jgi:hypothetical protein